MKKRLLFFPLVFLMLCCLTCKSPPPPPEEQPAVELWFDHIEAEDINRVVLYYRLRAGNPRTLPLDVKIRDWKVLVDGREYERKDAALGIDEASAEETPVEVPGGGFTEKTLRLDLNLEAYRDSASGEGDYRADLLLNLVFQYDRGKPMAGEISAAAVFPRIREPEFTITAIAILQAELINTRFRVNLRIDNPNMFPVDLSSFGYELYGAGRFWADGREEDILHIPARGSAETRLFLMMNFINMKRSLLDEVIAMRQVRYRFTGEAEVGTGVSWLPRFRMGFDHTGDSDVYK
ncbi:MAG: LEA type 2 family protein [Treponema sp.]|nr:LEA type 2 family protein [Treponema sp.]